MYRKPWKDAGATASTKTMLLLSPAPVVTEIQPPPLLPPSPAVAVAPLALKQVNLNTSTSTHLIPNYLELARLKGVSPDFSNQVLSHMAHTISLVFAMLTECYLQRASFEKDEPKLHLCNAQFEAYR